MQIRELESKSKQLEKLLYSCMRDIFSTARTNQANIDGIELNCPDDPPVQSRIGKHFVNQRGVNESLALIKRCERVLAAMDVCPECGDE